MFCWERRRLDNAGEFNCSVELVVEAPGARWKLARDEVPESHPPEQHVLEGRRINAWAQRPCQGATTNGFPGGVSPFDLRVIAYLVFPEITGAPDILRSVSAGPGKFFVVCSTALGPEASDHC